MCVSVDVSRCVVCACVCEREDECVCVCVCVWVGGWVGGWVRVARECGWVSVGGRGWVGGGEYVCARACVWVSGFGWVNPLHPYRFRHRHGLQITSPRAHTHWEILFTTFLHTVWTSPVSIHSASFTPSPLTSQALLEKLGHNVCVHHTVSTSSVSIHSVSFTPFCFDQLRFHAQRFVHTVSFDFGLGFGLRLGLP